MRLNFLYIFYFTFPKIKEIMLIRTFLRTICHLLGDKAPLGILRGKKNINVINTIY